MNFAYFVRNCQLIVFTMVRQEQFNRVVKFIVPEVSQPLHLTWKSRS